MYANIVVGTDGSDTASEAVRQAAQLAQLTGAKLHIVHAFQGATGVASMALDAGTAAATAGMAEISEKHAREVLERAGHMAPDIEVETHLQAGDAAGAVIATAEAVSADLIVVGNKGMTGLRRVLGSVPNSVSHHAPCSLLIVHTTD